MAWFRKTKTPKPIRVDRPRSTVPEGLWVKCEGCKEIVYSRDLDRNLRRLPEVRLPLPDRRPHAHRAPLRRRGAAGAVPRRSPTDPLYFRDTKRYRDRIKIYQQAVGERDAVVVAQGTLEGIPVVLAAMEYRFMGGSMGSVVGEKITRAAERALEQGAGRCSSSPPPAAPACRRASSR